MTSPPKGNTFVVTCGSMLEKLPGVQSLTKILRLIEGVQSARLWFCSFPKNTDETSIVQTIQLFGIGS